MNYELYRSANTAPQTFRTSWLLLLTLLLVLLTSVGNTVAQAHNTPAQADITRLQWNKQPGIDRYRLQIAKDDQFNDVLFDGVVAGQEYVVKDLEPGRYYWRLTSLDPRKGQLQPPTPFEVPSAKIPSSEKVGSPASSPAFAKHLFSTSPGWLAAIGEVSSPLLAQLRENSSPYIVGINRQGDVYAINSTNGVPLWIARYQREVKADTYAAKTFQPLAVNGDGARTIVAYERGVRALDSVTGREIWSRELTDHPVGGLVADIDGKPGVEIYLCGLKQMIVLDAATSSVVSETRLASEPLGAPLLLENKLLVPLRDGFELRSFDGSEVRRIETGSDLTTAPLFVTTSRGNLVLVGTKSGLATFAVKDFAPLERTELTQGDYPVGTLAVIPNSGSAISETLVMTTNLGRVVAIDLAVRQVKWTANNVAAAVGVSFADIDSDGTVEILLPGPESFAIALSSRDGSVVWSSDPESKNIRPIGSERWLKLLSLDAGRLLIVGNDSSGVGIRALQLNPTVIKSVPN
jgi:outer membrane protein assembly factor BamB